MRAGTLLGIAVVGAVACGGGAPAADEIVGVYHAALPAPSAAGRAVTLELDVGNAARMATDHLNGSAPIVESGTWSLNERGEVRVVLARDGFGPVTSDVTFRWSKATLTAVAFDTVRWGGRGFALVRD
jgi:hypothetical protein